MARNPARIATVLVADIPLAPRRRTRRDRAGWVALALLAHLLVVAALILLTPAKPATPDTPAPAEVALLFEGGMHPAASAPPSDRVLPTTVPAPVPGIDAETSAASPPPPPTTAVTPPATAPATATPPLPPTAAVPALPVTPETPQPAAPPAPSGAPTATPPSPAAPPAPSAAVPEISGTEPPPAAGTATSPAPPGPAAAPPPPPVASREPARPKPPPARPSPARPIPARPSPPRVTADGFPTTLMPSFDLSRPSSAARNAASPPASTSKSSAFSDVRGGEALGSDWLGELSAYVERHKRYPEQAAQNNEEGDATISIVVGRDGHVFGRDVDLVGRSGSQFLDSGLLSMFRDKQLPPFPPGAPHDRETIQITMHYYLIRR